MPSIAYFGNRYLTFSESLGLRNLMWVTNYLPESAADIVVLDTAFEKSLKLPKGVIGVVCSNNPEAVMCLKKCGVKMVTCGMSCLDTVTLSSSVPQQKVYLQRNLITLRGKILNPAEFTVNDAREPDCLLLASATRLLCGLEPK